MEKTDIYITQGKDYCEMTRELLEACYGSLIYALDRVDETGYLKGKVRESIAIGQGFRGKEGELGVGNCTRCFRRSLAGCPPKAVDIAEFLKREWKDER
ncbi:hypothetical protein [Lachnoclostridium sp. An118]|uniref:hypothetical protein n=1 Tax=Lachnoclostridium sp. An118 TaxID=1965547 RepID=UPI000B3ACA01|nr:hypothetical protein [Lachnoclostridium sp. An118]OUQ48503.1 hypothetical protein B5E62_13125 [Lachnoclostridium sp. An118]